MSRNARKLVRTYQELLMNALTLADHIHDGRIDAHAARGLVARGRVFLPFRYGQDLAFAPAKFIAYRNNSLEEYRSSVNDRSGSRARVVVSKLLRHKAAEDPALERRLENYCLRIGVSLAASRHGFWPLVDGRVERDRAAIDDIGTDGPDQLGNDDPEYRRRMAGTYVRDQRVRAAVLARARGRCEFCGGEGFETRDGGRYLETHHVISLAEQGPDKPSNVIALCADDHRRAHFGADWKKLQRKFRRMLAGLDGG